MRKLLEVSARNPDAKLLAGLFLLLLLLLPAMAFIFERLSRSPTLQRLLYRLKHWPRTSS